ncbi:glycosyltransferase family 39 protein [Coprothermobacter platensis]|uniref:glycosyltransferase family 39 protein n=1 Tax=Coprothermobacter platensis TaxID=108819 RepID=UPI0003808196|nr:glycosyltransferase family 39 protein [Coprothermobacter platensis]
MNHTKNTSVEKLLVVLIFFVAFALRLKMLFSMNLFPGTDGAYYLIQTRSILETGRLAGADTPLVFYIMAAASWIVRLFSSLSTEQAVLVGVKLITALAPALAAIPAYLLVRSVQKENGSILLPVAAACIVATLSSGPISLSSDFIKNSLGMVFFLFMAYYVVRSLKDGKPKNIVMVMVFLGLCGATHIGVFALALLFAAVTMLGWILFVEGLSKRALKTVGLVVILVTAVFAALSLVGISKSVSVLNYVKSALSSLGSMGTMQNRMIRGMGQTEGSASLFMLLLGGLFVAFLIQKDKLEKWELAIGLGSALATLFCLYTPSFVTYSSRFLNMAFGPGLIVLAILLRQMELKPQALLSGAVLAFVLVGIPTDLQSMNNTAINENVYEELSIFRNSITDSSHTLVIAQHGLEYWAGWILHTNCAQTANTVDTTRYSTVLYVQTSGGNVFGDLTRGKNNSSQVFGYAPSPTDALGDNPIPQNMGSLGAPDFSGNAQIPNEPPSNMQSPGNQGLSTNTGTIVYQGDYVTIYELKGNLTSTTSKNGAGK